MTDDSLIVTLSPTEIQIATQVAMARQIVASARGCRDLHGAAAREAMTNHLIGAAGELAVAKALGVYWDASVGTFKHGQDVGRFQVRTRADHNHDLIVRDDDRDDDLFILVTGVMPRLLVRGWLHGDDAKQPEFRENHGLRGPAYFVPARALRAPELLIPTRVTTT